MNIVQRWRDWREEDALSLSTGAAMIAEEEGSGASIPRVHGELDALAASVRVPPTSSPPDKLARILHHLFEDEGFRGDIEDYDNPVNSCIDHVLIRRRGLPILLAIVVIEVAERVDVALDGIGYPGHFLVGTRGEPRAYIDPFHRGMIRSEADLELDLQRMLGREPSPEESARAMGPLSPVDIMLRVSNNLMRTWLKRGDVRAALRNAERRVGLRDDIPEMVRDRGLLRARLGEREHAVQDLSHYLAHAPDAPDAANVSMQLSMLLR
jgi:regulator of sirC expression with transglutaminase-like and TPR domain